MDKETKIHLSPFERDLVTDAHWILTKNEIVRKVQALLTQVQLRYELNSETMNGSLPPEVMKSSAKISKGENYQGLPWVVLDYPRYFTRDEIFAIRTMFWWGRFFSVTLQISGKYKLLLQSRIANAYDTFLQNGFYYCVQSDPWIHHFEKDNYVPIASFAQEALERNIANKSFVKLSCKFPVSQWDEMKELLATGFLTIVSALT